MAVKRYQLTTEVRGTSLIQTGNFRCRIGYEKDEAGSTRHVGQRNAPILVMAETDIISTTNAHAQQCIEYFGIPQKSLRQGSKHTAGMVFEDVTATTTEGDVDIDLDATHFV